MVMSISRSTFKWFIVMFAVQSSLPATAGISIPSDICPAVISMDAVWPIAAKRIEAEIGAEYFCQFLAQLRFEGETAGIVELSTPTVFLARYVMSNYSSTILQHLRMLRPDVVSVAFRVRGVTVQHKKIAPAPIPFIKAQAASIAAPIVTEVQLVERPTRHTIHWLQGVTGDYFGVSRDDLVSPSRAQRLIIPRQVAMYFARSVFKKSTGDIGRRFGGRDHTTVIHAIKKIEALILAGDEIVLAAIAKIQDIVDQGVEPKDFASVPSDEPMVEALSA